MKDLLASWSDELDRCSRVFLRAPGHNRAVFFGGKKPLFNKSDPRLAHVSIETRRPTFHELQRVHQVLAAVEVCGMLHCHKLFSLYIVTNEFNQLDSFNHIFKKINFSHIYCYCWFVFSSHIFYAYLVCGLPM